RLQPGPGHRPRPAEHHRRGCAEKGATGRDYPRQGLRAAEETCAQIPGAEGNQSSLSSGRERFEKLRAAFRAFPLEVRAATGLARTRPARTAVSRSLTPRAGSVTVDHDLMAVRRVGRESSTKLR